MQQVVDDHVPAGASVLDAGCGASGRLQLPEDCHVTGVDMDPVRLEVNPAIDERICADLHFVDFPPETFDLVVCWDVLEHLRDPMSVLGTFRTALKPRGVLVLAVPLVDSLKARLAKLTPHAVHHLVVRGVGVDRDPDPTVLHPAIHPDSLVGWARSQGLELLHLGRYESWAQREARLRLRLTGRTWTALSAAVRMASSGRITADASDALLAFRRTPA